MWDKIKSRGRVVDRRGMAVATGGLSLTGLALLVAVNFLMGGDLGDIINQLPLSQPAVENQEQPSQYEGQDEYEVFASTVLGSNNDLWRQIFSEQNRTYTEPTLVLFRQLTRSGCGTATSQVGPHYCPLDQTIYLDETFFDELRNKLGAQGGDVAQAYVISHEAGHHAQEELGIMQRIQTLQQQNPERANGLSIQLELQADCFAGLWAHSVKEQNVFLPGEINEAMDAASAVGDDRIQQKVQGQVTPETWTHGSSAERVASFNKGYETGNFSSCQI